MAPCTSVVSTNLLQPHRKEAGKIKFAVNYLNMLDVGALNVYWEKQFRWEIAEGRLTKEIHVAF